VCVWCMIFFSASLIVVKLPFWQVKHQALQRTGSQEISRDFSEPKWSVN